jgi:hypothetical protein
MKGNGRSLPFLSMSGRHFLDISGLVLNDRQLKRHANLRGGQTDARRVAHGLAHMLNELLNIAAKNFVLCELPGLLPKHRFTHLADFEFQFS